MNDKEYDDIVTYLTSGKYPDIITTKEDKHKFRYHAAIFNIKESQLFYHEKEVLRANQVQNVLKILHDNPTCGAHLGEF